jgi:NADP-dependent 3-hydroxy acid dehydrogenase YdfG
MSKFQFIDADVEQVQLDVSDCSSIQSAVTQIEETAGKIDILVNNAGQGCVGPLAEVDFDKARQTFDINVLGLLAVTQAVTPGMMSRRNGLGGCPLKNPTIKSNSPSSHQYQLNCFLRTDTMGRE